MPSESCHISGGGRSLDIRKNFKTENEKGDEPAKEPEVRSKECSCALRLCHLFTVSLGYMDQSALGSNRGLTLLSCAETVCR